MSRFRHIKGTATLVAQLLGLSIASLMLTSGGRNAVDRFGLIAVLLVALGAFFADVREWGVYSDYVYTPNPDLKGFTNDHPFPPEITVESPYLKKRAERLKNARTRALAQAREGHFGKALEQERLGSIERSAESGVERVLKGA